MSKAHDTLCLATQHQITMLNYLKQVLRLVSDEDVEIVFSDGSKLIYHRTNSWRKDTLEVNNDELEA